nr:MAG TPA: hypothetical protein [Caudoviricetes sp.]
MPNLDFDALLHLATMAACFAAWVWIVKKWTDDPGE